MPTSGHKRGLLAEKAAFAFLKLKGYRILSQRYKCPVGEIDLVVQQGQQLAFVEVKARQSKTAAAESITTRQQERIIAAANHWLMEHPDQISLDMRFDAVLVVLGFPPEIQHIENAWQLN